MTNDLQQFSLRYPALEFVEAAGEVRVGPKDAEPTVTIIHAEDRWTVSTEEWHGHYESSREALDVAVAILGGLARTTAEYRQDKLAASWLEIWDETSYAVQNTAYYLNPFDKAEWELAPGEQWRTVRTHRRIVDLPAPHKPPQPEVPLGEVTVTERAEQSPSIFHHPEMLNRFDNEIGPPAPGMRWTFDRNHSLVFQAPMGWRLVEEQDPSKIMTTWAPPGNDLLLRVRIAFREAEQPEERIQGPIAPSSVVHTFEPVCGHAPDWLLHKWILSFTDGVQDTRAEVYLYQQLAGLTASERFREMLDQTLPTSCVNAV